LHMRRSVRRDGDGFKLAVYESMSLRPFLLFYVSFSK
jgi:hypothetical protein